MQNSKLTRNVILNEVKDPMNFRTTRGFFSFAKLRVRMTAGGRWGFTLIELLVAIVIIGLLAGFLTANYIGVRQRARDGTRKSDLRQIQAALELHRADHGDYPLTLAFGSPLTVATIVYMQRVPLDPLNTGEHVYHYCHGINQTYELLTCLENTNDTQKDDTNQTGFCSVPGDGCSGITNWSYTLENP